MSAPARRPRPSFAPLITAAIVATPLFFASLLAASLAHEKMQTFAFRYKGREVTTFDYGTRANEVEVWALAVVVPAAVLLVGALLVWLRRSPAWAAAAGILAGLALLQPLDRWTRNHETRWPHGTDLVRDPWPGSTVQRGDWEGQAHAAVEGLVRLGVGLGVAAIALVAVAEWRRRRELRRAAEHARVTASVVR